MKPRYYNYILEGHAESSRVAGARAGRAFLAHFLAPLNLPFSFVLTFYARKVLKGLLKIAYRKLHGVCRPSFALFQSYSSAQVQFESEKIHIIKTRRHFSLFSSYQGSLKCPFRFSWLRSVSW